MRRSASERSGGGAGGVGRGGARAGHSVRAAGCPRGPPERRRHVRAPCGVHRPPYARRGCRLALGVQTRLCSCALLLRRYAHRAGRAGRPGCASDGVSLLLVPMDVRAAAAPASASPASAVQLRLRSVSVITARVGCARCQRWLSAPVRPQAEGKLADLERTTGVLFQRIWSVGDGAPGSGAGAGMMGGGEGGGGGGERPGETAADRARSSSPRPAVAPRFLAGGMIASAAILKCRRFESSLCPSGTESEAR